MENYTINMVVPKNWANSDSVIKVLGVGGAGCNAVEYMYNQKVHGCSFIVTNTDAQALNACTVPEKIQLGEGLGAGTDPSRGRNESLRSQEQIKEKIINSDTQMLFITAGMGGGTGTGATPVIAKMAKEAGILTVAVVTLPFNFEGEDKMSKAEEGIRELAPNVDSLIIIRNEHLYKVYGDLLIQDAYPKVDEVLCTAVKGILSIIKERGNINADFMDIQNLLRNSGMALMGMGIGKGDNRLEEAVKGAFESPLLNDYDLSTSKSVLIDLTSGKNEKGLTMNDQKKLNELISQYIGEAKNFKTALRLSDDPEFGDTIKITAIATGFETGKLFNGDRNSSNIISIESDYTHTPEAVVRTEKKDDIFNSAYIGYNTTDSKIVFKFAEDAQMDMLSTDDDVISKIRTTPAIKRIKNEKN